MVLTRRALSLLLASFALDAQSTAEADEVSRFQSWMEADGAKLFRNQESLPQILSGYKQKLIADGMQPSAAGEAIARLQARLIRGAPGPQNEDATRVTFDRMYTAMRGQDGPRTTRPNAFLAEVIASLRPGKALDLGMGLGRNTIFLAQKGWDVTGIDISEVGISGAHDRARSLGVSINAIKADVNKFDLQPDQWDLVCVLYFVVDESMPNLHGRIAKSVKPGGLVIVEGVGHGGTLDALLSAWSKWEPTKLRLLRLEYLDGGSDWGGIGNTRLLLKRLA